MINSALFPPASARQRVFMRYALAYPKRSLLHALGFEKGGLHTRLEAVFALISGLPFRFLGAFFASHPPAGFNALRAGVPQSSIHSVPSVLKRALGIRDCKRCLLCIFVFWAHFLLRKKPGFPLQFLVVTEGNTCGISASIPCAEEVSASAAAPSACRVNAVSLLIANC
jgi:hypothetical protein